jgi:hypothetical protein
MASPRVGTAGRPAQLWRSVTSLSSRVSQIDMETGTDFWLQALQKDMKKIMVAFEYDNI